VAVSVPVTKPPAQPSSQNGDADRNSAPPQAGDQKKSLATATQAPSANGASAQATIAAYRSLREVAAGMAKSIAEVQPRPKQIWLFGNESDLDGLGDYRLFEQAVGLLSSELNQIRKDLRSASRPPHDGDRFALSVAATTTVLGDVISKILVPLAPKFTFSDVQLSIESATLLRCLASDLAAAGFDVFTPLSLVLRQGPATHSAITDALTMLHGELWSAQQAAAQAAEAIRPAVDARLAAIAASITELHEKLTEDREAAQRLLNGAAISAILSAGLAVHVSVNAAAAQVQERSILVWAWRVHAGGIVATYTAYANDGTVVGGGVRNAMMKTYRLENLPP
jgi:hypothetical protein